MGFVNSLTGPFVTVSYQTKETTIVNGQITSEEWTTDGTFTAKFQRGSMAQNVVSDKYKAEVEAIIFVEPDDLPVGLSDIDYRLVIDSINYSIIYVDNIEDVSVEIPLKMWAE